MLLSSKTNNSIPKDTLDRIHLFVTTKYSIHSVQQSQKSKIKRYIMENNDETTLITLVDEDGEKIELMHILTFMYEDERYMALAPADTDPDAEEAEILFMHIVKADGEDGLEPVENEVLLDEIFEVFCELMESDEGEE